MSKYTFFLIFSIINKFQIFYLELHQKNVKSLKETESKLKSKLTKAESEVSDLGTVQQDLEKLRNEFDTLSKNHLRTTEDLNRY